MPNLWMMGDSFAEIFPSQKSYQTIVADALGFDLRSVAISGTSLPHLFSWQWGQVGPQLRSGDILLILLTSPYRTWFFRDVPSISTPACINEDSIRRSKQTIKVIEGPDLIGMDRATAMLDYYEYLHRDDLHLSWLRSWLIELDQSCQKAGCRSVVIDCFDEIDVNGHTVDTTLSVNSDALPTITRSKGSLYDISRREFANGRTKEYVLHNLDPRMNHLGIPNHELLAGKILASLRDGGGLDLSSGFLQGYVDITRFRDDDYLDRFICWPRHCRFMSYEDLDRA